MVTTNYQRIPNLGKNEIVRCTTEKQNYLVDKMREPQRMTNEVILSDVHSFVPKKVTTSGIRGRGNFAGADNCVRAFQNFTRAAEVTAAAARGAAPRTRPCRFGR